MHLHAFPAAILPDASCIIHQVRPDYVSVDLRHFQPSDKQETTCDEAYLCICQAGLCHSQQVLCPLESSPLGSNLCVNKVSSTLGQVETIMQFLMKHYPMSHDMQLYTSAGYHSPLPGSSLNFSWQQTHRETTALKIMV